MKKKEKEKEETSFTYTWDKKRKEKENKRKNIRLYLMRVFCSLFPFRFSYTWAFFFARLPFPVSPICETDFCFSFLLCFTFIWCVFSLPSFFLFSFLMRINEKANVKGILCFPFLLFLLFLFLYFFYSFLPPAIPSDEIRRNEAQRKAENKISGSFSMKPSRFSFV